MEEFEDLTYDFFWGWKLKMAFNTKIFFIILTILLVIIIAAKPVWIALRSIIKNITSLGWKKLIDKEHWEEVLKVSRKKILKTFLAGASVTAIILSLIFYIYIKTGFKLWVL